MTDFEKQSETRVRVVDLDELYPDVERMPVSSKLRTYLRQVSLKIVKEEWLENNPYLARLVTESSLFLPEMFLDRWVKHWEYQVAIPQEDSCLSTSLDFAINRENEILIIDWSGMQSDATPRRRYAKLHSLGRAQGHPCGLSVNAHQDGDRLAVAQAYLLSQRLGSQPKNISVISLIANSLNEDRRINFIKRQFGDNDFYICQQELNERFVLLARGEDLNPVSEAELKEPNPLQDIESIPEIAID